MPNKTETKQLYYHARQFWLYGLILAFALILLFGALTFSVEEHGYLTVFDQSMATSLHQQALASPTWEINVMNFTYHLGQGVVIALAFAVGMIWVTQKDWRHLLMLAVGVAGGAGWFLFLAKLIDRHRPVFQHSLEKIAFPGFPSGHLVSSTTFYTLMLYVFWPHVKNPVGKAALLVVYFLILGGISYGRLFLGAHYLTDVIAGFAVGMAWCAIVYPGIDYLWERKMVKK